MLIRIFLIAGWTFPLLVLLFFAVKGQYYNPALFVPATSVVSSLIVPSSVGNWILEDGLTLPADRMYEKINGKSDYYLQYGVVELITGEWIGNGQRWDMYLYHFEMEQGAEGAYTGEKPGNGKSVEGMDGYMLPGQVALSAGTYYMQLNALTADADAAPAVELAKALIPHLESVTDQAEGGVKVDLVELADRNMTGDAEGFVPESAFGFSVFNNVRTVDVILNDDPATWFTMAGDTNTVTAFAEELAIFGGEGLFSKDGVAGGSMFGSWSIAGVVKGAVWGTHNAPSHESLMQHWATLQERLNTTSESP